MDSIVKLILSVIFASPGVIVVSLKFGLTSWEIITLSFSVLSLFFWSQKNCLACFLTAQKNRRYGR